MFDDLHETKDARAEYLFTALRAEIDGATTTTAASLLHKARRLIGELAPLVEENDAIRNARHDLIQAVSTLANALAKFDEPRANWAKQKLARHIDDYRKLLVRAAASVVEGTPGSMIEAK